MKKSIITTSILAAVLTISSIANAATANSTLNVSAAVLASCTVSTTTVNFGNLAGLQVVRANGDVSVSCSTGVPYHIALDGGLTPVIGMREMKVVGGTAIAPYDLWSDNNESIKWGDSDYANTFSYGASVADTGNGLSQSHIVHGGAYTETTSPPGAYSDTVNVTVYY